MELICRLTQDMNGSDPAANEERKESVLFMRQITDAGPKTRQG